MNKTLKDILQIGGMLIFWITPPLGLWISGIWPGGMWWFFWWAGLGIGLGATEAIAYFTSGRTLTQHLTKWAKESTKNRWILRLVLILWSIAWGVLMWHLWV